MSEPLTHQQRVDLAVCCYGLYLAPLANEVDARCAMDNAGVPVFHEQLSQHQHELLDTLAHTKVVDEFTTAMIDRAVRQGNITFEPGWDQPPVDNDTPMQEDGDI